MSVSLASSMCAAIFLPLTMTFSTGLDQRRAADRDRARAVRAQAELHLVGVAEHDLDVVRGHAELAPTRSARTSSRGPARDCACPSARSHGRSDARAPSRSRTSRRARPGGSRCGTARVRRLRRRCTDRSRGTCRGCADSLLRLAKPAQSAATQRSVEATDRIAAVVLHHDRRLVRDTRRSGSCCGGGSRPCRCPSPSRRRRPGARARTSPRDGRRRDKHPPATCW